MKRETVRSKISYESVYEKALEVFGYNKDKAIIWYMTKQEKYGNKSPYELCKAGRSESMLKELSNALLVK